MASCSTTIDFKVPGNRFHTPETAGESMSGGVGVGIGQGHKYVTATVYGGDIFGSKASVTEESVLKEADGMTLNANLGILPNLDFYYFGFHDATRTFGLKYQFLGSATGAGHKASIMAAIGSGEEDRSGLVVNDGSSERSYNANLEIDAYEFELIYGYRFTDYWLIYTNANFSSYNTKTSLSSPDFDDVMIKGKVVTKSLLLGGELSAKGESGIIFEVGVSETRWENDYDDVGGHYGISLFKNF